MRKASGPTPLKLTHREINDATEFRYLVGNLEEASESRIIRFNYETIETPKSTPMPKSALTPQHAVDAARHGFKIINPHQEVAIKIERIKSVSPAVQDYIDHELLGNVMQRIRKDGLQRPIRVRHDPNPMAVDNQFQPFSVVDDDLLFRAVAAIHEQEPGQFGVVPCEVVYPDEVIVSGTSQKLVMTWNAEYNEQIKQLKLPNLSAPAEGRYILQVEPRSLMGAMFYLSHAIRVPPEHEMSGLVVVTADEFGTPFDWTSTTGDLLQVNFSTHKPQCASVAVRYRRYWFYIDDRDHSSKATFALLMQLFELRASGGAGRGPVLTLPVGI